MRGSRHSADTKAAAIAALLAGQSVAQVAAEYKLPIGTVKGWSAQHRPDISAPDPEAAASRRAEIGDLLVDYLRENLTTLRAQSIVFRDAEWLKKQDAAGLAVLHGVLTDKAVRLLEALGGAADVV